MYADLDDLKLLNDRSGHEAGDALLLACARAWPIALRPRDLLARVGGDEFVVVLPNCDGDAARQICERLRAVTPLGHSASTGVATWDGAEGIGTLLDRADHALYAAKAARQAGLRPTME